MSDVLSLESKRIAEDLYALLQSLDPSRRAADAEERGRVTLRELSTRLHSLREQSQTGSVEVPLQRRLSELQSVIEETAPDLQNTTDSAKAAWNRFRRRAAPAYEALAASLKAQDIHVPSLRPTNYYRNAFHVGSGIAVLLVVQFFLTPMTMIIVSGAFAAWAWSVEFFRRSNPRLNAFMMTIFGKMAHPHERHRVNSATWYATALLLIALSCDKLTASLAVIVLAVGDPAAAIIGRRFGKIRLVAGRSLEGSSAFVVAAALGAVLVQAVFYPMIPLGMAVGLALAAAVPGAVAELVSKRIDDNFTIPLAVALGASIARFFMGF